MGSQTSRRGNQLMRLAIEALGETADPIEAAARLVEKHGVSRARSERAIKQAVASIVVSLQDHETQRAIQTAALRRVYQLAIEDGDLAAATSAQRELSHIMGTRSALRVEVSRGVENVLESVRGIMSPTAYAELLDALAVAAGVIPMPRPTRAMLIDDGAAEEDT